MALRGSSLDEAFNLLGNDTQTWGPPGPVSPSGPLGSTSTGPQGVPPLNAPPKINGFNNAAAPLATGANERPMPVQSTNTPLKPAPRIEDTVEYQTMQAHLNTGISKPPIRTMQSCEDFQVHLRNCPTCRDYMRQLLNAEQMQNKSEQQETTKERFANLSSDNQLIDLGILIGIGFFIILVLDCLTKLVK